MHPTELPADVTARVIKRRGHIHPFDSIDGSKTALIVIDMQKAFCEPGMILAAPHAKDIVPNINRLAQATRQAGGKVVWVQMGILSREAWPVFLGNVMPVEEDISSVLDSLRPGGEGYQLLPELDTAPGDWSATKSRFSAFMHGVCDLPERLKAAGIDTVLITGTVTNVCCECSARDAAQQDFKVLMVSDGNVCRADQDHIATLSSFIMSFGDVRTTDEIVTLLSPVALTSS